MARLYTIEEIKPPLEENEFWSNRDHMIFRFRFDPESIPNYSELLDWVQRQPRSKPFPKADEFICSVTAHYESHVLLQNRIHDGVPRLMHYDLRVYTESSANWLRQVWHLPQAEYDHNLRKVQEIRNRAQGHIMIGSESYAISELMVKPGVLKQRSAASKNRRSGSSTRRSSSGTRSARKNAAAKG